MLVRARATSPADTVQVAREVSATLVRRAAVAHPPVALAVSERDWPRLGVSSTRCRALGEVWGRSPRGDARPVPQPVGSAVARETSRASPRSPQELAEGLAVPPARAVPELRQLDEEECRRLLQTASFGRIAVTERALPTIVPVLFTVRGDAVIAVSPAGSPAVAPSDGTVVALEIDSYDPTTAQGWSVTVLGKAALVTAAADAEALASLGISPWPAPHRHYITMTVSLVQGRRLVSAPSLMNAG